jgi:hypothetical protein
MVKTPRRSNVFVLLAFVLALHSSLSAQPPTPNRRLEIEQTSAGPVVHGIFSPLEHSVRDMPECGTCNCHAGSNRPGFCATPYRLETFNMCPANHSCNYQEITPYFKGSCVCLCTQYTGMCTGCDTAGYCSSSSGSKCAAGSPIP